MGVPNSEVGYTSAMPRREDHEVRKGHEGHWIKKKKNLLNLRPVIFGLTTFAWLRTVTLTLAYFIIFLFTPTFLGTQRRPRA